MLAQRKVEPIESHRRQQCKEGWWAVVLAAAMIVPPILAYYGYFDAPLGKVFRWIGIL